MADPLFYILAPFGLAFALFGFFILVSILLKDPARPFRMFAAKAPDGPVNNAETLLGKLYHEELSDQEREILIYRLQDIIEAAPENEIWDEIRYRLQDHLDGPG
jgi:hypothetical protein